MKKLFLFCLMATTILAFDSCRKDPVVIDDNGNVIDGNQKPIASFTYTTQQITGGIAIYCNNTSTNATSYVWELNDDYYSSEKNPVIYIYEAGTYNLRLTAYNGNNSNYTYKVITVKPAPTGYEITSLKLTKIPMLDGNNASWDTGIFGGGEPDIFFKIMDYDKVQTFCTGQRVDDVSSLPISWTITNTQLEIGTKYIIQFLDYDDGIDPHDIMANCVWEVKASQEGQTTINWNAQSGTISFVVGIKWLYPSKGIEELICVEEDTNEVVGEVLPE